MARGWKEPSLTCQGLRVELLLGHLRQMVDDIPMGISNILAVTSRAGEGGWVELLEAARIDFGEDQIGVAVEAVHGEGGAGDQLDGFDDAVDLRSAGK